jgi:hypothetical protein
VGAMFIERICSTLNNFQRQNKNNPSKLLDQHLLFFQFEVEINNKKILQTKIGHMGESK